MISYNPFNYYRPRLSIWIWLHLPRHDRLITRFLSVVTQFRQLEILLWNFYEANVLSLWIWRWTKSVSPTQHDQSKIPESLKRVIFDRTFHMCFIFVSGRTLWVACSFRETRVPKQRVSSSHPGSKEMQRDAGGGRCVPSFVWLRACHVVGCRAGSGWIKWLRLNRLRPRVAFVFLRLLPEAKLIPPKFGMEAKNLLHRWS